ncbi:MAG: hypothetical protein ACR2IV_19700 [Bryobacteraceae bacterium]
MKKSGHQCDGFEKEGSQDRNSSVREPAAMLGWKEQEIIGQPAAVFFTPEDIENGEPGRELRNALRKESIEESAGTFEKMAGGLAVAKPRAECAISPGMCADL